MDENEKVNIPDCPYSQRKMKDVQKALAEDTPADQIQWIHQFGSLWDQQGKGWTALALAVANARFFQDRLDIVCGAFNWQSETKFVGGILMVGIGIRNPENPDEWIWKWDTGQEAQAHTDMSGGAKSVFSRGYKRAGYQWGIGRDLYSYPKPRVKCRTYKKKDKTMFAEFTESIWAVLGQQGRGESTETGRVHKSRVDDKQDEIKPVATAFYDIAYGKLQYDQVQANEIASQFYDSDSGLTDWDKAIKKLEENLVKEERFYTIQEWEIAEAKKEAEAEAKSEKSQ